MIIIGLTGGIGMGKTTAAGILREYGLPLYNADQVVHQALRRNGAAVKKVAKLCPQAVRRGAIDRKILGDCVFANPEKLSALEKILHPLTRKAEREFLRQARRQKKRAVVLEIPLLFETGAEKRCDVTVCVTAARKIQKTRVMLRPNMTAERFKVILARQMPDAERRRRSDYVVRTDRGLEATRKHVEKILHQISPEIFAASTISRA